MSGMSMPYEIGGRSNQKQRTREALVAAAKAQVGEGRTPTVEEAAAAAGISRTTAYRYFPNQRSLLAVAHPETVATSMLSETASNDPAERLEEVVATFVKLIVETELQQRTMLKLSLEADSGEGLPLRQGRAITWITEALDPLRGQLSDAQIHSLVLAIRSATGIESLVWLTDIGGLSRDEAAELMLWSSRSLLQAATAGNPPKTTERASDPRRTS
jgi:AcrR family transcriptional regulator